MRYTVVHDQARPARERVVDADKGKPKSCVHSRPMVPKGTVKKEARGDELNVTICRTCEFEAPLVKEIPADRGHGD